MRLLPALILTITILRAQGIPPRVSAAEYLTHQQVADVTIAAEFLGHSLPTSESILQSEDYVVVETALYGATPDAKLKLSVDDFSLRINGKKTPLPGQPYEVVFKSLKDPELEPTAAEQKEKTNSVSTGGSGKNNADANLPPPKYHPPIALQRAWQQRVAKASLLEGERQLPQAGWIYFEYRGKAQSIHSVELIYSGPAGKLTMALQP